MSSASCDLCLQETCDACFTDCGHCFCSVCVYDVDYCPECNDPDTVVYFVHKIVRARRCINMSHN